MLFTLQTIDAETMEPSTASPPNSWSVIRPASSARSLDLFVLRWQSIHCVDLFWITGNTKSHFIQCLSLFANADRITGSKPSFERKDLLVADRWTDWLRHAHDK
jgi:hypothetical protein